MAKPSKLDRAIEAAKGEFDAAEMEFRIKGAIYASLVAARGVPEANAAPKAKRGRKPKAGLPRPEEARPS